MTKNVHQYFLIMRYLSETHKFRICFKSFEQKVLHVEYQYYFQPHPQNL